MTENAHLQIVANPENAGDDGQPPRRLRLPLSTAEDVKRELARIYREGKAGQRDVADVSKLANVLAQLARLIETSDVEKRLEKLETQNRRAAA
jgi:uncharacterized Zn finger protein (UPF0148 family)